MYVWVIPGLDGDGSPVACVADRKLEEVIG